MLIDLDLDPGIDGLQMYEATDVLLRDRPLQPDVPCLLWQVGVTETSLYSQRPSRPSRFHRLHRHLLKFYAPSHEVRAITSSDHPLVPPDVSTFPLADLPVELSKVNPIATLFIPPAEQRPIARAAVAAHLEDPARLREMTRPLGASGTQGR